jgi:hypothetical protein
MSFITKDSGQREEFASGMVRDTSEGKLRYHRVAEGPMLKRWAGLLCRGAEKYPDPKPGVANWTQANGEAEYARFRISAYTHFMQWWYGDQPEEDHAAAVFFNINGAEYTKERIEGDATIREIMEAAKLRRHTLLPETQAAAILNAKEHLPHAPFDGGLNEFGA